MAANGTRYSNLDTAFNYRRELANNCTCNGRDAFGTAAISIYADVTLRPGDIAVTNDGLRVFVGSQGDQHQPSEFTPVQQYSGLSAQARKALQAISVASNPDSKRITFDARIIFWDAPVGEQGVPFEDIRPDRQKRLGNEKLGK